MLKSLRILDFIYNTLSSYVVINFLAIIFCEH